jgi:hypothetical protein
MDYKLINFYIYNMLRKHIHIYYYSSTKYSYVIHSMLSVYTKYIYYFSYDDDDDDDNNNNRIKNRLLYNYKYYKKKFINIDRW